MEAARGEAARSNAALGLDPDPDLGARRDRTSLHHDRRGDAGRSEQPSAWKVGQRLVIRVVLVDRLLGGLFRRGLWRWRLFRRRVLVWRRWLVVRLGETWR